MRIFKLCDHDKDGFLSNKELNEFQVRPISGVFFHTHLRPR